MKAKCVLPAKAPELWPGKYRANETVTEFFRRVWKPYLTRGLTRAYLKEKDLALYTAYTREIDWPSDLRIKTESEVAAQLLFEKAAVGGIESLSIDEIVVVSRCLRSRAEHLAF